MSDRLGFNEARMLEGERQAAAGQHRPLAEVLGAVHPDGAPPEPTEAAINAAMQAYTASRAGFSEYRAFADVLRAAYAVDFGRPPELEADNQPPTG